MSGIGNKKVKDLVVLDFLPLSLGIGIKGGVMSVVISRNTAIPTKKENSYSTADDSGAAAIEVYQGERKKSADNHLLGKFSLSSSPPVRKGFPITVCF